MSVNDSTSHASNDCNQPRWLARLTISCWAAWLANAILFFAIWRFFFSPHAAWGILSCVSIGGLTLAAVFVGLRQIVTGSDRRRSVGYLLIVLAPLSWFACHVWELSINAKRRNDVELGIVTRVTLPWILSIAETEARWRLPQRIHGKHVVLLDDGNAKETQELVAAADEHLERMANQLGRQVPEGRFYWIRREILGQGGCAIANFAFCNQGDSYSTELTELDRHELAHTLITVLAGPDISAPALLAEGWAQVHSSPPSASDERRTSSIRHLARMKREDRAYSLRELIAPSWYNAARGAAYNHGEPLVFYLLERFGGERFFDFYSGVRRDTFSADCERILGVPWETLTDDFWQWLDVEDARLTDEEKQQQDIADTPEISLADDVSSEDWNVFVEGYRSKNPTGSSYLPCPRNFCFEISSEARRIPGQNGSATEKLPKTKFTAAFIGESFWAHGKSGGKDDEHEEFYWCTPTSSAHLHGKNSQSLKGRVRQYDNSLQLRGFLENNWLWMYYGGEYDPANTIPSLVEGEVLAVSKTVTKLQRPSVDESQPWIVEVQYQMPEKETGPIIDYTQRLTIDPTSRWLATNLYFESSTGESYECKIEHYRIDQDIMPIVTEQHYQRKDHVVEAQTKLKRLSDLEIETLKQSVESQVRKMQWRDPLRWASWMKWLSLGLPAIGFLLLSKRQCGKS